MNWAAKNCLLGVHLTKPRHPFRRKKAITRCSLANLSHHSSTSTGPKPALWQTVLYYVRLLSSPGIVYSQGWESWVVSAYSTISSSCAPKLVKKILTSTRTGNNKLNCLRNIPQASLLHWLLLFARFSQRRIFVPRLLSSSKQWFLSFTRFWTGTAQLVKCVGLTLSSLRTFKRSATFFRHVAATSSIGKRKPATHWTRLKPM
jgi:hypothetical protein